MDAPEPHQIRPMWTGSVFQVKQRLNASKIILVNTHYQALIDPLHFEDVKSINNIIRELTNYLSEKKPDDDNRDRTPWARIAAMEKQMKQMMNQIESNVVEITNLKTVNAVLDTELKRAKEDVQVLEARYSSVQFKQTMDERYSSLQA